MEAPRFLVQILEGVRDYRKSVGARTTAYGYTVQNKDGQQPSLVTGVNVKDYQLDHELRDPDLRGLKRSDGNVQG